MTLRLTSSRDSITIWNVPFIMIILDSGIDSTISICNALINNGSPLSFVSSTTSVSSFSSQTARAVRAALLISYQIAFLSLHVNQLCQHFIRNGDHLGIGLIPSLRRNHRGDFICQIDVSHFEITAEDLADRV